MLRGGECKYESPDLYSLSDVNSLAQDDLTPLHYAARYTPKGTADMDVEGPLQEIDLTVPLPPTQVCFIDHT